MMKTEEINPYIEEVKLLKSNPNIKVCDHISEVADLEVSVNPCYGDPSERTVTGGGYLSDEGFLPSGEYVQHDNGMLLQRAGPKKVVVFKKGEVNAAILTCGGICPGLNVVIRELFMTLTYNYGVQNVYGIKYGYMGIYQDPKDSYIKLSTELVKSIHKSGGTVLGSSRGGFDLDKIIEGLLINKINMLFVIGGDGTHRGILKIGEECMNRKLKIIVAGIPKTIDNDIPLIDRTFGFETAVEESIKVIEAAQIEATSAPNGIGLVKLFGRSCGFISLFAALASRDVNVCLIPEEQFNLYGKHGVLEYVLKRVQERGHCVIVVAEGAGEAIRDMKVVDTGITDKSGNKKLAVSKVFNYN